MSELFQVAIDRLKRINWYQYFENKPSFNILISEFTRRSNVFRDIYDSEDTFRKILFKPSKVIGYAPSSDLQNEIDNVIEALSLKEQGWIVVEICSAYLEWMYLADCKVEEVVQYLELYNPIIKLFERGGRIVYHKGELLCGRYSWPRNCCYLPREPMLKIEDSILDKIDLKDIR